MISPSAFDQFFAYAPLAIGLAIYLIFFLAKRHEVTETGIPIGQTYACASCGRRGARDHMIPRDHEGAVSWYCANCSGSH